MKHYQDGYGRDSLLVDGRLFYWGHYIDEMIATQLLLRDLTLLALANWRREMNLL